MPEVQIEEPMLDAHHHRRVKRVCLVALGVTAATEYLPHCFKKDLRPDAPGAAEYWDEVWTVNRGIRAFRHDVAWVLDDLRNEAVVDPDYGARLREHDRPIITTTKYPEFPMSVGYPIHSVFDHVGQESWYFHNSIPMILAYAHLIGVEEITLWGCDYSHPQASVHEDERANCEYWVGWCRAKGMRVGVPMAGTLLNQRVGARVYGFLGLPELVMKRMRGW